MDNNVGPKRFYLKLEEGSFQRPAFYISIIGSVIVPNHRNFRWVEAQVDIQYFGADFYDTLDVGMALQLLLSGGDKYSDVLLPRYDYTKNPPEPFSTSGFDQDGQRQLQPVVGARISPESISNSGVNPEDNQEYNVVVSFQMRSPLPTYQELPYIENVQFDLLTGQPVLPQIVCMTAQGQMEVELVE